MLNTRLVTQSGTLQQYTIQDLIESGNNILYIYMSLIRNNEQELGVDIKNAIFNKMSLLSEIIEVGVSMGNATNNETQDTHNIKNNFISVFVNTIEHNYKFIDLLLNNIKYN